MTKDGIEYVAITILDFVGGTVFIRPVPADMQGSDAEEIATYYEDELCLHLTDCEYMLSNTLNIKV